MKTNHRAKLARSHTSARIVILTSLITAYFVGVPLGSQPSGATSVPGASLLQVVACPPSSGSCVATGVTYTTQGSIANDVVVPLNDGQPGAAIALPSEPDDSYYEFVNGGVCSAQGTCWLVGYEYSSSEVGALIPFTDGQVGTTVTVPAVGYFSGGISCPTKTVCWVAGYSATGTTDYLVKLDAA